MNRLQCITLVSKVLIKHLELRKQEMEGPFIWVKFSMKAFDKTVFSKEEWHKHLISVAASCSCEYVNHLMTDYDTRIMYFFTNPGHVQKTAMEQLQEASYAR